MEIDITSLVARSCEMHHYSASQMELGPDAGRITWENSLDNAEESPLLTEGEQIETARDYFGEFGAWDDDERAAWSAQEVNALLLQLIAGDIREALPELLDDYEEYKRLAEEGPISSRIFRADGRWYYYVGM